MNKITELRRNNRKNGSFLNYIYVKQTDYFLNPISRNEVEVWFEPEFWEYYGTISYILKNDSIFNGKTDNILNRYQLLDYYNTEYIRDLIREKFKPHILAYIAEQQKALAETNENRTIKRQEKILEKEREIQILKSNITNEKPTTAVRDKIKGLFNLNNTENNTPETEIESDIFNGSFEFEDNVPVLEEKIDLKAVSIDDFEFEEEKDCFDKIEEFKDDDFDFKIITEDMIFEEFEEIKEEVVFEEFEEVKTDDFDFTDDLSHSPTLPAAQVIEYFETLFTTQIEPSSPIVDYIAEASAKLKYLTYEAETKQKITEKEKEIQSLKSLLKLNTEIMNKSNNRLKEIKNKLK